MFRVFGNDAVLSRLERLGVKPRTLNNLISVGFSQHQLEEARQWYAEEAISNVQRYAVSRMSAGYFDDEPLLILLSRYFQCTDWQLEASSWFFSREDYERFIGAVIGPIQYYIQLLALGEGEERWGEYFQKLPFDIGMTKALTSLWEESIQREYYWRPQRSYLHLRAANLMAYLGREINIHTFSEHQFKYEWERRFRHALKEARDLFQDGLERATRVWQENRRERTEHFSYGAFGPNSSDTNQLLEALKTFGLNPATATSADLRKSYRNLSKRFHPDQGGTDEAFRRLANYRAVVERWLGGDGGKTGSPM